MGVLDLYRLDGRVGIVTGAGWGLGADFAVALAEAGADVVLAARRADRLATTAAAVEAAGRRALVVPADVADPDQCGVLAAVLGEVDEGFRYVQVRLGPARMAHVMRWLGAAVRAHETALDYVTSRSVFGRSLGDHGLAQHLIAENEIDLAATRALLDVACAALDGGSLAAQETSIAKTFGAEAIGRIVDRAAQLCGGLGVSADLPVARIAREVRPFRVYDGPSEVHRFAIANRAVKAERQRLGA